jgi:hypothetical protein
VYLFSWESSEYRFMLNFWPILYHVKSNSVLRQFECLVFLKTGYNIMFRSFFNMISIQRICFFICLCTTFLFSASKDVSVQFMVFHSDKGLISGKYFVDIGLYDGNSFDNKIISTANVPVTFDEGAMNYTFTIEDPHHLDKESLYVGMKVISLAESVFVPLVSVPSAIYAHYAKEAGTLENTKDWLSIDVSNQRLGIGTLTPEKPLSVSGDVQVAGSMDVSGTVTANMLIGDGSRITNLQFGNIDGQETFYLSPKISPAEHVVVVDAFKNVGIGVTSNIQAKLQVVGTVNVSGPYIGSGDVDVGANDRYLKWLVSKGSLAVGYPKDSLWGDKEYTYLFGKEHTINSNYAAVVGGQSLAIGASSDHSSILGGKDNTIGTAEFATILGGEGNSTEGKYSAVLAGNTNIIDNAEGAVILGGFHNGIADGADYSVAMGHRSKIKTDHKGVFLFSDSIDVDRESSASNQFLIFAENGVGIGTNNVSATPNSLRVEGNVNVGGYIYGDGSKLENVKTAWTKMDAENYIFYNDEVVIGSVDKKSVQLYVAGDVAVTGSLTVAAGSTNIRHTLSKVSIGSDSDDAVFSHLGVSKNAKAYALKQTDDGVTNVNAPTGKPINLSIEDIPKLIIHASGDVAMVNNLSVVGVVTSNGGFVGNGEGLTSLKPRGVYSNTNDSVLDAASGESVTLNRGLRIFPTHTDFKASIVLQDKTSFDANSFKSTLDSTNTGFEMSFDTTAPALDFEVFLLKNNGDELVKVYQSGALAVGEPDGGFDHNEDRLYVSGNAKVSKDLNVGNDMTVSNNVTVENSVTIGEMLKLTPYTNFDDLPDACNLGDVFAVDITSEGGFDVCVCVNGLIVSPNSKSLLTSGNCKLP